MKIIGIRELDFTAQDGKPIKGTQVFLSEPMDAPAQGVMAVKVFLPANKLVDMEYVPVLGDEVNPVYNRWGKCEALYPVG